MARTFIDQLGNTIKLSDTPKRIVSLVPSQTELLFDLRLDKEVVGITKFCIHPEGKVKGKAIVGGTKNFDTAKIASLKPDLIIANKEENYKEGIEALQKVCPVWVSDIQNVDDACEMILNIGEITDKSIFAAGLVKKIRRHFRLLKKGKGIRTAYFIWRKPYMSVGIDTFIHNIMNRGGFKNVFSDKKKYPIVSELELKRANPELILLSSEPYPFDEKHIEEFKAICPDAKILLVDGELFSWYGSRMQYTVAYIQSLQEQLQLN